MDTNTYTDFVLKNIPRVLTQIDRDEHSTTYGSCDRNHWHLKIRDFSSAILQQSGLSLAILHKTNFPGNIYFQNENIKQWAQATVYYWAKIQLNDGSYNEYYPYEHGFPPTAFSLYSSCEIYKRLKMEDEFLLSKFAKTAGYLKKHCETKAMNQEMASITAIYSYYTIVKEERLLDSINVKLKTFLDTQTEEGWFPEYGGADLGYLSVTLDMLAEYYDMSGDERVCASIMRIISFMKFFVHPDATVGGEYGSRNTTYCLPNGLEVAAQMGNDDAMAIKLKLFSNTTKYNYFMDSIDDRYLTHYVVHSFLRALEKEKNSKNILATTKLPCEYEQKTYFKEAGLISFNNNNYFAIVSLKKGGILKIFRQGKEIFLDCGYRINYGKGAVATTNWLDDGYIYKFNDGGYMISGIMNKVKLRTNTPPRLIMLRIIAFIFGNKIINMLKKLIIFNNKHCDIKYTRKITFNDTSVDVYDEISSEKALYLESATNMSLRHVASGKFFMTSDMLTKYSKIKIVGKISNKTQYDVINTKTNRNNELI